MPCNFEYLVKDDLYNPNYDTDILAETLAEIAEEGWELVSVTTWHTDRGFEHVRYFFKRPKPLAVNTAQDQ